jgi:hypothetical protein
MKNALIAILLVSTLGLGAIVFKQKQQKSQGEETIGSFSNKLAEAQGQLEQEEQQTAKLQNELVASRTETVVKSSEVANLKQALTNGTAGNSTVATIGGSGSGSNAAAPLANMLKNKDMRDLIRTQQKAVMGPMVEKNYGGFFSTLGLNSEQTATLKDLIVKKTLVDADMGVSMLAGDMDPDKRTEMLEKAKADKDAVNDQIKAFLGEDNYPQFKDYEKTQPERTALGMFKDQQASGPGALTGDQENLLVKALYDERQNFKFTTDFYDQSKFDLSNLDSIFTEEHINQFDQERQQLDQRYLERARSILRDDQIEPFQKFLSAQDQMQMAGMKMAVQMFGKKGSN